LQQCSEFGIEETESYWALYDVIEEDTFTYEKLLTIFDNFSDAKSATILLASNKKNVKIREFKAMMVDEGINSLSL
tara:strand:+ start:197 stop:424 length:228 start_codon:yes stop_codon:yes gene_type:complete